MFIWGKVWGFIIGMMLSKSIIGALFGVWIGHSLDKLRQNNARFSHDDDAENSKQKVFFDTVFTVMGFMAKANGRVSKHEINFASNYMDKLGLTAELKQQAKDAFVKGKSSNFDLDEAIERFVYFCGRRQDLRLMLLEIEIQVAFADGVLDEEERDALHRIAKKLGYSSYDLDKLLEMILAGAKFHEQEQGHKAGQPASANQIDNAYKLLGLNNNATEQEIKKAYRKLMSQHHPDKLVARGLPPEMMKEAKEKTQDIQAAYEMLSKQK